MRVDFSPLYRSTIGFDRLANMLETVTQFDPTAPAYPPYNIEQRPRTNTASPWRSPASVRAISPSTLRKAS